MKTMMRWLPALAWMGFIFWLSSRPKPLPVGLDFPDKLAHFSAYAVLGALLWWAAVPLGRAPAAWLAVTLSALYGASDEAHQQFVVARSAEIGDWVADLAGAAVAAIIVVIAKRPSTRKRGGTGEPPP